MSPTVSTTGCAASAAAHKNPFLSRVGVRLRADRPEIDPAVRYTVRTEVVGGAVFARLWFRTRGCSKDRQGSCAFCNYGGGGTTDPSDVAVSVADGLVEVAKLAPQTLLVSPSGSMLDDAEVPPATRAAILRLLADTRVPEVLCETRAETVTDGPVAEWADAMAGRRSHIEMGLESADPWISTWCLNKTLNRRRYLEAVARIMARGVGVITNVVVGTPFLTPGEAVDDAVRTVTWALAAGSGSVVLFPLHVRGWTVLEPLWRSGRYEPPSLWALVEVLRRLGPGVVDRVSISWYRDYDAERPDDEGDPTRALASPTTCPRCAPAVLDALDDFRAGGGWPVVAALDALACPCHDDWRRSLDVDSGPAALRDRVVEGYEALGRGVLGVDWWARHGSGVVSSIPAAGLPQRLQPTP